MAILQTQIKSQSYIYYISSLKQNEKEQKIISHTNFKEYFDKINVKLAK